MSSQSYLFNPTERTLAAAGDGFSCPRLTTAGRTALTLTAGDKGMMVYDTTLTTLCIWTGTAWEFVGDSSSGWVSVKDFGAKGDGVTDDTAAFNAALTASNAVLVPVGTYRIQDVDLNDNKTIFGQGWGTVIKLATGATVPRLFSSLSKSNNSISNMKLDGEGVATFGIVLVSNNRTTISSLYVTGINGYSVYADSCNNCLFNDITFVSTGALGGYSALYLNGNTSTGSSNKVINIFGDSVTGRLVTLTEQFYSSVQNVTHINVIKGEAVYFLQSEYCSMDMVLHIGGGVGPGGVNPGNDGCAIDKGCAYCSASNLTIKNNSGHGLSISGGTLLSGAKGCTVTNVTVVNSDEGGIAITDQGVAGSFPTGNTITNCVVENAGQRVNEAAYSVTGGTDNNFVNCTVRDTQGVHTTTYGFQEISAANAPSNNHWSGLVTASQMLTAEYLLASSTSSAINLVNELTRTKVTFDGTGAVGAQTVYRKTANVNAVNKLSTGRYQITFFSPIPAKSNVSASARFFGGKNFVVVDVANTSNSVIVQVYDSTAGGVANDSDYVSVVIE